MITNEYPTTEHLHMALEDSQQRCCPRLSSEQPKQPDTKESEDVSRAGTRSISTLSTDQLERRQANDRDAQRASRPNTKEHVDSLKKTISELRRSQKASERLISATRQHNGQLEEENARLRKILEAARPTKNLPRE